MEKYSGKAKDIILLENEQVKVIYRNSISAFDGVKTEELEDKGKVNCLTSSKIFEILNNYGFSTHYMSKINENEHLCKHVRILPIEVVCRNISAGSFCRRYGFDEGIEFDTPIIEFFVKDDEYHDPLITESVAIQMKLISQEDATLMEAITRSVNEVLLKVFESISLKLVDFKLEFGKTKDGELLIADEISADTMRLWEMKTGEKKDKDRYRQDLGDVIAHYKDILQRLETIENIPKFYPASTSQIVIRLRKSVLDPAGEVTYRSLMRKGYDNIETVRLGKSAEILFSEVPSSKLQGKLEEISEKILSNPLIEDFSLSIRHKNSDTELNLISEE